jgi:hypothetical protein
VRTHQNGHGDRAYVVTEAHQSRSAEINQRQRRYLLMMGIRVVCFVVTVVLFLNHAGWLTVIPAAGAIALPYFAVVVANARQPGSSAPGFHAYEPNLPQRYDGSSDGLSGSSGSAGSPGSPGSPGGPPGADDGRP